LLEGEDQGTNGPAEGSPPADADVTDKGDGAAAGAGDSGSADAGDHTPENVLQDLTPEQIAALPDEDVDAFVELFGERIEKSPAMQERMDRRAQSMRDKEPARPETDPFYREVAGNATTAYEAIQEITGRIGKGEDVDLTDLPVRIAENAQWLEASERRGQILVTDLAARRALGLSEQQVDQLAAAVEAGEIKDLDPVQVKYVQAKIALDKGQRQAHRLMRDKNEENRKKAPTADATAAASFIAEMMETMRLYGQAEARTQDASKIEKRVNGAAQLAGSNAFREALATAAANRQAAAAGATGGLPQQNSHPDVSVEEFTAMTKEQRQAFRKARPDAYKRTHRKSLGFKDDEE
jgi:hypothetical protein